MIAACFFFLHTSCILPIGSMDPLSVKCKKEIDKFVGSFVHYSYLTIGSKVKIRCSYLKVGSEPKKQSSKITNYIWGIDQSGKKIFSLRVVVRKSEHLQLLQQMLHSIGNTIILRGDQGDISTEAYSSESEH